MSDAFQTISPIDGRVVAERGRASQAEVASLLARARPAQQAWRRTPLAERIACCSRFVDAIEARRDEIAREITLQMGRPVSQTPAEIAGLAERARHMIAIAPDALADRTAPERAGFVRFIRREPQGVVLVIAPWNYPFLTAVNSVVPAILAGNAVVLRPSEQTPLTAERFGDAFDAAGLPPGVFQTLHCSHERLARLVASPDPDHVVFTGSVAGGRAIKKASSERFIDVGLELGGKDPAYVRADADLHLTIPELVYGFSYNAGQSCCGVERIYVQREIYDVFVRDFVRATRMLRLGDPLDEVTTLGPMVRPAAAEFVRRQIEQAVAAGAEARIPLDGFPADLPGSSYLAPQVLVDVSHEMALMSEETFGPAVGIMPVDDDDEAVRLMNDSVYGLTASVWTADLEVAQALGDRVRTGTWFMNRCDYVDPALAWTGVGDSGRGVALSPLGFDALTRPKSFHLRKNAIP